MKRFISLIVSLCMLMSCSVALADTDTLFAAICAQYFSAEATAEFSIKADAPLTFINILAADAYESISPVDFQALAESALNIKETASSKVSLSEDFKKIKAFVQTEAELPLRFNDSLTADVWSQAGVWTNLDFSDINKPVTDIVAKVPFSTKYFVFDYATLASSGVNPQAIIEAIEKFSDAEYTKELNEKILQLIRDNSDIKEKRKNTEYIISINDEGLKKIFAGAFDIYMEMLKDQYPRIADEFTNTATEQLEEIEEIINSIPVLGKDGCTIKINLAGGKLASIETTTDISVNIYDYIAAFEGDVSEYNRNDWQMDLTLSSRTEYTSLDGKVEIDMPATDSTNSVNPTKLYGYDDDEITISTTHPIETNDKKIMIPLRDCMLGMGICNYTISEDSVAVNFDSEKYGFEKAVFTNGSDNMEIDGNAHTLSSPVEKGENGLILIPVDAMEILTDSTLDSISIDLENGPVYNLIFEKNEPTILYEDTDYIPDDDKSYEDIEPNVYSPTYYMGFNADGRPVMKNGLYYLPARSLFEKMGFNPDEMSFENGSFTVKNTNSNIKEFSQLVITENSTRVYIDGNESIMSKPVTEIDGSMYIPEELLALIDCKIRSIEYDFGNDNYYMPIYRNKYAPSDSYDYKKYLEYLRIYVTHDGKVVKDENGYYLPLRLLMNNLYVADENITLEGETVKIIGTKAENGFELITVCGNKVTLDGEEYTMKSSLTEVDGSNYIPAEFVTDIMGGKITSVDISYSFDTVEYSCRIKNPMYEGK